MGLLIGGILTAIGAGVGMGFLLAGKAPTAAKVLGGIGLGLLGVLGIGVAVAGGILLHGPMVLGWAGNSVGPTYAQNDVAPAAASEAAGDSGLVVASRAAEAAEPIDWSALEAGLPAEAAGDVGELSAPRPFFASLEPNTASVSERERDGLISGLSSD